MRNALLLSLTLSQASCASEAARPAVEDPAITKMNADFAEATRCADLAGEADPVQSFAADEPEFDRHLHERTERVLTWAANCRETLRTTGAYPKVENKD